MLAFPLRASDLKVRYAQHDTNPLWLKLIAALKEVDGLQLLAAGSLLFVGHVLERRAVGTEVQPDELHDALAAHDVTAVVADDVDDLLREILQFASLLEVTGIPSVDDAHEVAAVVVGGATDTALCAAHGERGEYGLVLSVEHVVLAVLVEAALVVLVDALKGVFDTGKVGDAPVDRLEEVDHREVGAVEGRYMVVVEGEVGSSRCYLFAVFHQLLDAPDLGEGRCHGADTEGAYLLCMSSQAAGTLDAGATHMYDDLETLGCGVHPHLGEVDALLFGEHVALAR